MMMFMDWSGSMHSSFYETITQLFNLVFFCKQIKLPYKVYAFSDRIAGRSYDEKKMTIGITKQVTKLWISLTCLSCLVQR